MEPRLSVGDALSEVFRIYREQAGVLLPVAFWLFLIVAVVNGLTEGNLSLFWLGIVASLAVGTLYQGMVVELVLYFRLLAIEGEASASSASAAAVSPPVDS